MCACGICKENYTIGGNHNIVAVSCSHSLCLSDSNQDSCLAVAFASVCVYIPNIPVDIHLVEQIKNAQAFVGVATRRPCKLREFKFSRSAIRIDHTDVPRSRILDGYGSSIDQHVSSIDQHVFCMIVDIPSRGPPFFVHVSFGLLCFKDAFIPAKHSIEALTKALMEPLIFRKTACRRFADRRFR
eukprot:SAG31_NODE_5411_length_2554_cov_1.690865_3_plen_185_part_00